MAHPFVGPQALVAERLLLVAHVIRARRANVVLVILQNLRNDHFLFFAQLRRFAEQAIPVYHRDVTLLLVLQLPVVVSEFVRLLLLAGDEHLQLLHVFPRESFVHRLYRLVVRVLEAHDDVLVASAGGV